MCSSVKSLTGRESVRDYLETSSRDVWIRLVEAGQHGSCKEYTSSMSTSTKNTGAAGTCVVYRVLVDCCLKLFAVSSQEDWEVRR